MILEIVAFCQYHATLSNTWEMRRLGLVQMPKTQLKEGLSAMAFTKPSHDEKRQRRVKGQPVDSHRGDIKIRQQPGFSF